MGEGNWKEKNQEVGKAEKKTSMSFEELDDAMKRMARERAAIVWPPRERDKRPTGREKALEYIDSMISEGRPGSTQFYVQRNLRLIEANTKNPSLYSAESIRTRVAEFFSVLPRDFLDIFRSGERQVLFVFAAEDEISGKDSLVSPVGGKNDGQYTLLIRQSIMEAACRDVFTGRFLHELCHVVLDHPSPIAWPGDPTKRHDYVGTIENEAIKLACELGFARETLAYVKDAEEDLKIGGWTDDEIRQIYSIIHEYYTHSS